MTADDIRSKDQPFFISLAQHPPTPSFRNLLEIHSKIPSTEIDSHLHKVREDAWAHYPFPSIGLFAWLDLGVSGDDLPKDDQDATKTIADTYQRILKNLKGGGKFLDVGCMFAQDARKLVYDGAPPSNIYGTDLHDEYFDLGYELFRDQAILPRDHFIAADILDTNEAKLKHLEGKVDTINATHLLHVFSIEDQHALLGRFIQLLKPEPGVIVTGRATGHLEAGYKELGNAKATTKDGKGTIWEHNVESLKTLWKEVGENTGTKWDVKAWFWRFGNHTVGDDKPANWHRNKEHGIVSWICTRL